MAFLNMHKEIGYFMLCEIKGAFMFTTQIVIVKLIQK
jgi:hypothetical protein